jgi:hypothetical protein
MNVRPSLSSILVMDVLNVDIDIVSLKEPMSINFQTKQTDAFYFSNNGIDQLDPVGDTCF